MDLAVGVAGFIGLTGQILQGCSHLRNFFRDVGEAPEIIQSISESLCVLESALNNLDHDLRTSSVANLPDPFRALLRALESCQMTVEKFGQFVSRYDELQKTASRKQSNQATATNGLDVSFKSNCPSGS